MIYPVFRDEESTKKWLRISQKELGGNVRLELLKTEAGAQEDSIPFIWEKDVR